MRACSVASSIKTSPTPRSRSVRVAIAIPLRAHVWIFHDSRHANNLAGLDDQGPGRPLAARHLRVDEDVLHLLAAPAQAIAGAPRTHLEAGRVGGDRPRAEADRAALERDRVVLADRADAAAEVSLLRALAAGQEPVQRLLQLPRQARALVGGEGEQVVAGPGVELLQQREDLRADQAAFRVRVRAVAPVGEPGCGAVRLGVLAPQLEQRPDDTVLALRLDPAGASARDEPVEDGLDLVGGGVAGGAETVGRERVAEVAELVLRLA